MAFCIIETVQMDKTYSAPISKHEPDLTDYRLRKYSIDRNFIQTTLFNMLIYYYAVNVELISLQITTIRKNEKLSFIF